MEQEQDSNLDQSKARLGELMDESCANPHHGEPTLREAMQKQFLDEDVEDQEGGDSDTELQFEFYFAYLE